MLSERRTLCAGVAQDGDAGQGDASDQDGKCLQGQSIGCDDGLAAQGLPGQDSDESKVASGRGPDEGELMRLGECLSVSLPVSARDQAPLAAINEAQSA